MINLKNYKIIYAKSFNKKLRGLFWHDNKTLIIFINCNDIHTFFCKQNIDIAFFDNQCKLIKTIKNVKPWKRIRIKKAFYVIERYSNSDDWF